MPVGLVLGCLVAHSTVRTDCEVEDLLIKLPPVNSRGTLHVEVGALHYLTPEARPARRHRI